MNNRLIRNLIVAILWVFLVIPTTAQQCGEFGITYVDNTTGIIYHRDNNYRANFNYLCLNGDCRPGTLEDGYYKRTVNVSLNQTYNVEFKVDDTNGQVIVNDQFTFTTATCSFTGGGGGPTCTDGIQNGDEAGVDCGGSCPNSCTPAPTCSDGIQNGDETGVDCGGSCPNSCTPAPTCSDGIQNGDETGVDCGGNCPNSCSTSGGGDCGEFGITYVNNTTGIIYHRDNNYRANFNFLCLNGDCRPGTLEDGYYKRTVTVSLNQNYSVEFKVDDSSGQVIVNDQFTFTTATCSFTGGGGPTCTDGVQNGDETGVDCGGSCPNSCTPTPTCTDGVQNGDETGVDCGGSCPNSCTPTPTCTDGIQNGDETGVDCGGSCPNSCTPTPTCTDGVQNGDETGVDCGGSCPNSCTPTPTCTDGIQNGNETGVDCGGSCTPCVNTPPSNAISGKFTPKDGRTFLTIGQDLGSVDGYVNSGLFPDPAGVTMYTDVYEMAGLTNIVNYGAGDVGLQEALDRNPTSALSIGLWMVEDANQDNGNGNFFPNGLTELVNGLHDNDLDAFATFAANNSTRPIFLRIGYEFDGPWNGYDAGRYVAAYQYIVDYLNGKNVTNVAYVWQSATWGANAANSIDAYYPGDAYVDYVGLSFFFFDANFNGNNLDYTLEFARTRNIPIMMAEVSAQYYEFDQGTFHPFDNPGSPTQLGGEGIWNQYFVDQLLPFVKDNRDVVRHVAYINADWQSQPLWMWPDAGNGFWGDTRIEANSFISQQWANEISDETFWLHGSANLLDYLEGTDITPPTPTCTDGVQNGDETGVDCGGSCPNSCIQEPTCTDGVQNGDETGVDCGGSCPNSCTQEPTCTDGVQNGDETGVDCGGSCPNSCPPVSTNLAFLEPINGDKLLFIGQDLLSASDYITDCQNCPTPGGIATYVNMAGVLQNNFYGALGWTEADQPYGVDIDWGGGPLNAHSAAVGFPNSAVQIGLYLVGETDNIAGGGRDAEIRQMADFFKSLSTTAFYLRVGYEFDGNWNGYSGPSYINAYKKIVDILRAEGVNNVAYVWQASTSPIDDILDGGRENLLNYYPGDDYVDWFGMSWFLRTNETATSGGTPSTQLFLSDEMMNLARERNKPMMICEAAAQGYDILEGTNSNIGSVWDGPSAQGTVAKSGSQIWNEWFQEFFNYINANDDVIKAVTYINADWDSQDLWDAPYEQGYWGDTRIQANATVENNWVNQITQAGWLHGSANINSQLNGFGGAGARTAQDVLETPLSASSDQVTSSSVFLYPNPVKDKLTISGVDNETRLKVVNTAGKVVKTVKGNVIDVSNMNAGIYFVEVGDRVLRFIKD